MVAKNTTTIRVNTSTHALLKEMAKERGLSMTATLDLLLKEEATRKFWARMERPQEPLDPEARELLRGQIRDWKIQVVKPVILSTKEVQGWGVCGPGTTTQPSLE